MAMMNQMQQQQNAPAPDPPAPEKKMVDNHDAFTKALQMQSQIGQAPSPAEPKQSKRPADGYDTFTKALEVQANQTKQQQPPSTPAPPVENQRRKRPLTPYEVAIEQYSKQAQTAVDKSKKQIEPLKRDGREASSENDVVANDFFYFNVFSISHKKRRKRKRGRIPARRLPRKEIRYKRLSWLKLQVPLWVRRWHLPAPQQ